MFSLLEKSFPRAHQPELFFPSPKWKTEKVKKMAVDRGKKGVGMLVSPHHFRHGGGEIREGGGKSYKPPTPCRESERDRIYTTSMFLSL